MPRKPWLAFWALWLAVAASAQNTPKYPAALFSHEDLLVINNAARTKLASSISAADTTIVLADGTKFFAPVANTAAVIAIEREFIKYCGRSGNTITVCAGGRGFDGSTATSHTADGILEVVGIYIGWHHNQLAAEIIAMQAEILRCSVTSELTISGGAITIPGTGCYSVDTEADAASDDLTSFVCAAGVRFKLFAANDARTVVIKRGSGAIEASSDFALDNVFDTWEGRCRTANVAINEGRNSGGP